MDQKSQSVEEIKNLVPEDRKEAFEKIREVILINMPEGFEEDTLNGMISYVIPLNDFPEGYHTGKNIPLPLMQLASQKNHLSLYHFGLYVSVELKEWFLEEYRKRNYSHRINIGKSCIRFKYMNEIPYDLIGKLVSRLSVRTVGLRCIRNQLKSLNLMEFNLCCREK